MGLHTNLPKGQGNLTPHAQNLLTSLSQDAGEGKMASLHGTCTSPLPNELNILPCLMWSSLCHIHEVRTFTDVKLKHRNFKGMSKWLPLCPWVCHQDAWACFHAMIWMEQWICTRSIIHCHSQTLSPACVRATAVSLSQFQVRPELVGSR